MFQTPPFSPFPKALLLGLNLWLATSAEAFHPEEGLPLVQHFSAKDYSANPHCSGVAFAPDGTLISASAS